MNGADSVASRCSAEAGAAPAARASRARRAASVFMLRSTAHRCGSCAPFLPPLCAANLRRRYRMAWDFSTEPEFQQQLDWMRDFVREEIWPIETVFDELGQAGFERVIAPLREQVKERGLW